MLAVILAGCGGIWIQPPRSLANIAALERVEVKSYVFEQAGGLDMEYGLFVPGNYQPDKPSPLVVALHGNGGGLMYMMEYNHLVELAENYGFLVVTPIGFSKTGWFGSEPIKHFTITAENKALDTETISRLSEIDVINVLNEVQRHYNIDESRIYLIGQSMGGGGVWYLGSKYSQIWAALAPLSPVTGEDPVILEAAKHLPVMVVAGDADIEMDIAITRLWVAKMDELGMQYEYLEIEAGTHSASGRENIGRVFEFLNEQHK
ncbi:MAG: hypothetical protein COC19_03995 [SAR86 cluster bacterium]|uniref:Phospholipase/carboxylesterase/thioesterase domain-containing protein n=1 Tax=SAR86 cluster bacterium TaxID=2030880 RepID=A0A2A4MPM5_9GAMM|nr:MAG: hypothetical protein COC19_03995 [SAR86 cluster bacterium]